METEKLIYGRGSRVKRCKLSPVYTLLDFKNGFWNVVNPDGRMGHLSDQSIGQVLVDGHWMNYTGDNRKWKRVY